MSLVDSVTPVPFAVNTMFSLVFTDSNIFVVALTDPKIGPPTTPDVIFLALFFPYVVAVSIPYTITAVLACDDLA